MANLSETKAWIERHLPALLERHRVPGAAVAVYAQGEVVDGAAGLLSTSTGVEATSDSLFQIGSITKVWTTTLIMQLVDDGPLRLDDPVRTYLPEFRLADETAAATITVRQLLCHTGGFEGDIFVDTGVGDDCVEKYIGVLGEVGQLFLPGEFFSYNNAGFCVLGRVIEVLRGKPFDKCLEQWLFGPLGLQFAATGPYDAILHRAAVGHLPSGPEPESVQIPAGLWALVRSNVPAGSMLSMRPRDLLAFAALHLDDGRGPDGAVLLSAASVAAMQEPQVKLPRVGRMPDSWGLGWGIYQRPEATVIGHDGGTIGQAAFLRVVPEHGFAVALLTNGGDARGLYQEVVGHIMRAVCGLELPAPPRPPSVPVAVPSDRYIGTYSSDVHDIVISARNDTLLWLESTPKPAFRQLGQRPESYGLVCLDGDTFISVQTPDGKHLPHAFLGNDGRGRALYIHSGRATRRTA